MVGRFRYSRLIRLNDEHWEVLEKHLDEFNGLPESVSDPVLLAEVHVVEIAENPDLQRREAIAVWFVFRGHFAASVGVSIS